MAKFTAFSQDINAKINDRPTSALVKRMFASMDEKFNQVNQEIRE
jgi:hypothetical protein